LGSAAQQTAQTGKRGGVRKRGKKREEEEEARADEVRIDGERARDRREEENERGRSCGWLAAAC
jgi:hypothetical protein